MRISDWSSDVCSSDLPAQSKACNASKGTYSRHPKLSYHLRALAGWRDPPQDAGRSASNPRIRSEERRVGKSVSVRVELGGHSHTNKITTSITTNSNCL